MSIRIAWISALGEGAPRSTAFTREVFSSAPKDWQVVLFSDALLEGQSLPIPVEHYIRIGAFHQEKPFDVFIYQIEDCEEASFIHPLLSYYPGINIVHDLNLNRSFLSRFKHSTGGTDLNREMDELFGKHSARLGDWQVRGWDTEVFDKIYIRGAQLLKKAAVNLVFGQSAAEFLRKSSTRPVLQSTFPLGFSEEVSDELPFQIEDERFVVAYAGKELLSDRVDLVIEAFGDFYAKLSDKYSDEPLFLWFLQAEEDRERFEKRLQQAQLPAGSYRLISESGNCDLEMLLSRADVFLAPRFDEHRAVPLSLLCALRAGVPTISSELGSTGELPNSVVLKLPVGRGEQEALVAALEELFESPALGDELSSSAQEYVETVCHPLSVLRDLEFCIEEYGDFVRHQFLQTETLYTDTSRMLVEQTKSSFLERDILHKEKAGDLESGLRLQEMVGQAAKDFSWEEVK